MNYGDLVNEFQSFFNEFKEHTNIIEENLDWEVKLKYSDYPGVYIIFSEDKKLAYVGQSKAAIGYEVWAYVDKEIKWRNSPNFQPSPHSVICIALNETYKIFAPALESYIIDKLRTNKVKLLNIRD